MLVADTPGGVRAPAAGGGVRMRGHALRRGLLVVLSVMAASVVVAGLLLALQPTTYTATSVVRLTARVNLAGAPELSEAERLANTYRSLLMSDSSVNALRAQLAEQTGRPVAPVDVEVESPANTELLLVHVTAPAPDLASAGADTLSTLVVNDLSARQVGTSAVTPLRAEVYQDAIAPTSPDGPSPLVVVALACLLGAITGVAVAAVLARRDPRLHLPAEITAATGVTVLDVVRGGRQPVLARAALALRDRQATRIAVLGHGSTELAPVLRGLAAALAQAGAEVLVVQAERQQSEWSHAAGTSRPTRVEPERSKTVTPSCLPGVYLLPVNPLRENGLPAAAERFGAIVLAASQSPAEAMGLPWTEIDAALLVVAQGVTRPAEAASMADYLRSQRVELAGAVLVEGNPRAWRQFVLTVDAGATKTSGAEPVVGRKRVKLRPLRSGRVTDRLSVDRESRRRWWDGRPAA